MSAALASVAERAAPETRLRGPHRVAALLMLLGEEHGAPIWSQFDEAEVRSICLAMAELGAIRGLEVERLMDDFATELAATGAILGNADRAEELLAKIFPAERVAAVMADVRGASGRQVWRRMAHVPDDLLARFLADEHGQTVAVVLSRIGPDHGGRILALLPDALAADVVNRMLRLGAVRPEALLNIEEMLDRQFLTGPPRRREPDPFEVMADRFNAFDRPTEARFLAALEDTNKDAASRIREKMFTFDDLGRLDGPGAQALLRQVDKDVLARALKGASESVRDVFVGNMSTRAAKNLKDDMEAMGAVRLKEVDEAQSKIVKLAKSLADKGEIRIDKSRSDEEVVS